LHFGTEPPAREFNDETVLVISGEGHEEWHVRYAWC
jgi:hypothetical protein